MRRMQAMLRPLPVAASLLMSCGAQAHEIGTTQVHLILHRDYTWSASITTAPQSLVNKLEAETGLARSGDLDAGALRTKFDQLSEPLSRHVEVRIDGVVSPISANVKAPTRLEIMGQYLRLGFTHIIPEGLDHILFVLGIFLLTTKLRPILVQVTAFTIAHSVTLGLTMYDVVSLPSRVVEPLIALSVAYVAIENIATSKLTPWRPAVVFGFGLLHGMGFAGALTELKLPREEIIPALISFNVGIESAQLTVIAAAFFAVALWYRDKPWYRARFVVPASAVIAATGLFWTMQRIVEL
jgi:hydrogenase/urease accessory protein HupE